MTQLTRDDVTIKFYLQAEAQDNNDRNGKLNNGDDLGMIELDFHTANNLLIALQLLGFDVPDSIPFNDIRAALKEAA